jgi:hypothetical protein
MPSRLAGLAVMGRVGTTRAEPRSRTSSDVSIETGLLSPAGVVSSITSLGRSPTPTDGCSEVGNFSEQVWGDPLSAVTTLPGTDP